MFVVNQSRDKVWNLNNFDTVELLGDSIGISYGAADGEVYCKLLGSYATEERAAEVFSIILHDIFGISSDNDKYTMVENAFSFAMPEE